MFKIIILASIFLLRSCDIYAQTPTITNQGEHRYRHIGRDLNSGSDTPVDEECATYESSTGGFEWQTCGSGVGLASTDIDTSAELRAIIADENGTGQIVFNNTPTLTSLTANTSLTTNFLVANRFVTSNSSSALSSAGSSADLISTITDKTGTGQAVFNNSPTLTAVTVNTSINLPADAVDALTEIAQGIKSAANDTSPLIIGTAGSNGEIAKWNTDGTLTDSDAILGTLTDARYCKYTSVGTLIDCNSTCADITGGAALCDGTDDGGGGGLTAGDID